MGHRLKIDGNAGVAAIYENTNDAPFASPSNYKSRVIWHTGLDYPSIVSSVTSSVTLASRSGSGIVGHQLFSHGINGIPMVEGKLIGAGNIGGADVPWVGSIPIQWGLHFGDPDSNWRWVTLGADTTYIYMHEMYTAGFTSLPSMTLNYTIHILDKVFSS